MCSRSGLRFTMPSLLALTNIHIIACMLATSCMAAPTIALDTRQACSSYKLVATSGPRSGQYLGHSNGAKLQQVIFSSTAAKASNFTIHPDGRVYDSLYGWITGPSSPDFVSQVRDKDYRVYQGQGYGYMSCAIGSGDSSSSSSWPGAVGALSCSYAGQPAVLSYCAKYEAGLVQSKTVDSGCSAAKIAAVPAC